MEKRIRRRFRDPKGVATDNRFEATRQIELLEDPECRHQRLVGHQGTWEALRSQGIKNLQASFEQPRLPETGVQVLGSKDLERGVNQIRLGTTIMLSGDAPMHQLSNPITDPALDGLLLHKRKIEP